MTTCKNVSDYILQAPKEHRASLRALRAMIRATVSDAKESISYGMPAYTWNGKSLLYFAAMKGHLGLYPTSEPIQALKDILTPFSTSKGCIRIPWHQPLPAVILKKLLAERKREIRASKNP